MCSHAPVVEYRSFPDCLAVMATSEFGLARIHWLVATSAACWTVLSVLVHAATACLWPQYSALRRKDQLLWCNRASSALHVSAGTCCNNIMNTWYIILHGVATSGQL